MRSRWWRRIRSRARLVCAAVVHANSRGGEEMLKPSMTTAVSSADLGDAAGVGEVVRQGDADLAAAERATIMTSPKSRMPARRDRRVVDRLIVSCPRISPHPESTARILPDDRK